MANSENLKVQRWWEICEEVDVQDLVAILKMDYIIEYLNMENSSHYVSQCMGYEVEKMVRVIEYWVWRPNPCKSTREIQKCMD